MILNKWLFNDKSFYMKQNSVLFILLLSSLIFVLAVGCKKDGPPALPPNHNEVNATIIHISGPAITIQATGTKAPLGLNGWFGGGGYVDGTNDANNAVYISIYPGIAGPGTYDYTSGYRCEYRINATSGTTPIYMNSGANAGNIIFTKANRQEMEGSFTAVCRYGTDSVIVSGSFKGDYIGPR
jgi:hypothetical protein